MLRRMQYAHRFELPKKKQRAKLWKQFSEQHNLELCDKTIAKYAETYKTSPSVISSVSEVASKAQLSPEHTKNVIKELMCAYNWGLDPDIKEDNYIDNDISHTISLFPKQTHHLIELSIA